MKGVGKKSFDGIIQSCAIAFAAAALIYVVGSLVLAIFIQNEYLNINTVNLAAGILRFAAVFVAGIIACKMNNQKKIYAVAGVIAVALLLSLSLAMLFFEIDVMELGWGSITVIGGGIAALVVCKKPKKQDWRRARRITPR